MKEGSGVEEKMEVKWGLKNEGRTEGVRNARKMKERNGRRKDGKCKERPERGMKQGCKNRGFKEGKMEGIREDGVK